MPELTSLTTLSADLADAVAAAGAWTVRVAARRGPAASGIALAPDLVLTADHVVDPRAEAITIGLPDAREVAASLVGRDPATDLAVLRVPADAALTPAPGTDVEPRPGSLALVVARPGSAPAASLALVSSVGGPARTRRGGMLDRFIQIDAVLYPGFSGGPLVGPGGEVLGMVTSGFGFGGPGIALPWSSVSRIAATIGQHGRVPRGYLGIGSQPIGLSAAAQELAGGQARGLLVLQVAEAGPAASGGVLQGDILVRIDGHGVTSADDLQVLLGPERVGTVLTATVVRGGELRDLALTVGTRD